MHSGITKQNYGGIWRAVFAISSLAIIAALFIGCRESAQEQPKVIPKFYSSPSQTVADPFGTVQFTVPATDGAQYDVSFGLGGNVESKGAIRQVDATTVEVVMPAGVFDAERIGRGGLVDVHINRNVAGVTETMSTSVFMTDLKDSPYEPGAVAVLVSKVSLNLIERSSDKVLDAANAATYKSNFRILLGEDGVPPILAKLSHKELVQLDRILYNVLLTNGLVAQNGVVANQKVRARENDDVNDFFPVDSLTGDSAETARKNGKTIAKIGGGLMALGTIGAGTVVAPLVGIGAVIVGVGLLSGLVLGGIMDNAAVLGGLEDPSQFSLAPTAQFYASIAAGPVIKEALPWPAAQAATAFFEKMVGSSRIASLADKLFNGSSKLPITDEIIPAVNPDYLNLEFGNTGTGSSNGSGASAQPTQSQTSGCPGQTVTCSVDTNCTGSKTQFCVTSGFECASRQSEWAQYCRAQTSTTTTSTTTRTSTTNSRTSTTATRTSSTSTRTSTSSTSTSSTNASSTTTTVPGSGLSFSSCAQMLEYAAANPYISVDDQCLWGRYELQWADWLLTYPNRCGQSLSTAQNTVKLIKEHLQRFSCN